MSSTALTGSAGRWGPLWGARPPDWALSEDQQSKSAADRKSDVPFKEASAGEPEGTIVGPEGAGLSDQNQR